MYTLTKEKFLDRDEYKKVYSLCRKCIDDQGALLVLMALHTGARVSELLALKPEDITGGEVSIKGIKGSRDRTIPLPPWICKRALEGTTKGEFIFPQGYHFARYAWADYTPNKKKTFHSLRHTFGARLYEATKDIRLVKYALGHANIRNTMIYLEYVYTKNELQKALAASI